MRNSFQLVRLSVTALVLLAFLGFWLANGSNRAAQPHPAAAPPDREHELNQLLKERHDTASRLLQMEEKRLQDGVTTLGQVCEVARWVRDSAVELPLAAEARLAALTNYVALTRRLEASVNRAVTSGAASLADNEAAHYLRLDAEITLLRAGGHAAQ